MKRPEEYLEGLIFIDKEFAIEIIKEVQDDIIENQENLFIEFEQYMIKNHDIDWHIFESGYVFKQFLNQRNNGT